MDAVQALKNLAVDRNDVDELMALKAAATGMVTAYAGFGVPTPVWLSDATENLDREIKARHRDQLERDLKDAERELDGLKTATERREDAAARIAKLKAALGR